MWSLQASVAVNQSDRMSMLLIHIHRHTHCTSQSSTWYVTYSDLQYMKEIIVV